MTEQEHPRKNYSLTLQHPEHETCFNAKSELQVPGLRGISAEEVIGYYNSEYENKVFCDNCGSQYFAIDATIVSSVR